MSKETSNLSPVGKLRAFIAGTAAEMRRCTWPDRRQLTESTLLVIVALIIMGCFVAIVDNVAMLLIRFVTIGTI